MSIVYRALGGAALLAALWWMWDSDRDAFAERAVQVEVDRVKRAADEDLKKKLAIGAARAEAAASAASSAESKLKEIESERNNLKVLADIRNRELTSLRNTRAGVRRVEIHSDPGSACHNAELRAEQLSRALFDLQGSSIEVGSRSADLESRLLECEEGARTDAVMLRWAQGYIRAVNIGAEPPPEP